MKLSSSSGRLPHGHAAVSLAAERFRRRLQQLVLLVLLTFYGGLLSALYLTRANFLNSEASLAPIEPVPLHLFLEPDAGATLRLRLRQRPFQAVTVRLRPDRAGLLLPSSALRITPQDSAEKLVSLIATGSGRVGQVVLSLDCDLVEWAVALRPVKVKVTVVHSLGWRYISALIGWLYFVCWSVSVYPQLITNYRRASVVGLSFDFTTLNWSGHVCYTIFNTAMLWSPVVRAQYFSQHPDSSIPVRVNDLFFSVHAVCTCSAIAYQCLTLDRGAQRLHFSSVVIISLVWCGLLAGYYLALQDSLSWLSYFYLFSGVKVLITALKYVPQVYLNWYRGSTDGYSIWSVWGDFLGGTFSLLQQLVDSLNADDWSRLFGNPGKMGLASLSLFYNSVFLVQHFCLYRHPSASAKSAI